MKSINIKVDEETVFTIDESNIFLLKDDMPLNILYSEIKRRVRWVIEHKCDIRFEEFRNQWIPILMKDSSVSTIPADKELFIKMVVSRPDYKDFDERTGEEKMKFESSFSAQ